MRKSTEFGLEVLTRAHVKLNQEELIDFWATTVVIYAKLLRLEIGEKKTMALLETKIEAIESLND